MNLRNVTIWTTGLMMFGILVYLWVYFGNMAFACFLWLFSGTPLLVSFVAAKFIETRISIVILLLSTIAYGFLYASVWYEYHTSIDGLAIFGIFSVCIVSLPMQIPAWIIVLILDSYLCEESVHRSWDCAE